MVVLSYQRDTQRATQSVKDALNKFVLFRYASLCTLPHAVNTISTEWCLKSISMEIS